MSLIDNLAAIREMQGKAPLPSPHHIQGFEPGAPPVPAYIPQDRGVPANDPDPDEFGINDERPAAAPSPLIPRNPIKTVAQNLIPLPPVEDLPSLTVWGTLASWKGRAVTLSEADEKAVRSVVLKAIQRELEADLSDAGAKRTRRSRAKAAPLSAEPAKPKRGRKA